jgi:hypothetical protein
MCYRPSYFLTFACRGSHFRGELKTWAEATALARCDLLSVETDYESSRKVMHVTTTCVASHRSKLNDNSVTGSRAWTGALRTVSGSAGIHRPDSKKILFAINRTGKLAGHGVQHRFAQVVDIFLVF